MPSRTNYNVLLEHFGYDPKVEGISPLGATEPFRLLTNNAVREINDELERIKEKTTFRAPPFAPCVQRGAARHSTLIRDLWNSPEVASVLSACAGLALKPHPMSYEVAHINIQEGVTGKSSQPVFGWHTDSQPFVCIVMLSKPPEGALGGETRVRNKNGEEIELTFPDAGYAYLLQGSILEHAAMPALNYERKTMITSFVPACPLAGKDDTSLGLSLQYSPPDIVEEYATYRLQRVADACNALRGAGAGAGNSSALIDDIAKLQRYLAVTKQSLEEAAVAVK